MAHREQKFATPDPVSLGCPMAFVRCPEKAQSIPLHSQCSPVVQTSHRKTDSGLKGNFRALYTVSRVPELAIAVYSQSVSVREGLSPTISRPVSGARCGWQFSD